MTTTLKKLYQGVVPNSATTLYTVPALTEAMIKYMVAVNTSGGDEGLTLWDGGTADSNEILDAATLIDANGGRIEFTDGVITLPAGGTLRGQASAASAITLTVYGAEFS